MKSEFPRPRNFRPERIPEPLFAADLAFDVLDPKVPLDLEIGCGVGWHSIRYARAHPERHLIAVEKTHEKFGKFAERKSRAERAHAIALDNLTAVQADAVAFVTHAIAPESLERVFIYYPNPARQNSSERWVRMPFFGFLLSRLKPGGTIALRTNLAAYAEEVRTWGVRAWGLELVAERAFTQVEIAPADAATHFERKYLDRGETCYEIILRRADAVHSA